SQHDGELRQQTDERRPVERGERAVVTSDLDVHPIHVELEIDRARCVPRLTQELPTLDVDADEEPADDPNESPDDTGKEAVDVHARPESEDSPSAGQPGARAYFTWRPFGHA